MRYNLCSILVAAKLKEIFEIIATFFIIIKD